MTRQTINIGDDKDPFPVLICVVCDWEPSYSKTSNEHQEAGYRHAVYYEFFAMLVFPELLPEIGAVRGPKILEQATTSGAEGSSLLQRYLSSSGGRWGSSATRALNDRIATQYEAQGYRITGGAGRASEEWIAGPGGATRGGTFVDITATNGTSTVRIQTIDTLANGMPTAQEAAAAARIRAAFPNDQLILVPK